MGDFCPFLWVILNLVLRITQFSEALGFQKHSVLLWMLLPPTTVVYFRHWYRVFGKDPYLRLCGDVLTEHWRNSQ